MFFLLNFTVGQFVAIFGTVSAVMVALYLLDRSRRRQLVATLRFWVAAEQPPVVRRRKHIQQPLSLILQIVSVALLLLAIAQLRFGSQGGLPRDHVLILETSAWMSARVGPGGQTAQGRRRTLMDDARDRALAYVRALPASDRVMLVRADALTTPATAFEPNRKKLEQAIAESRPGAMALNLDQALAFARRIQARNARRPGEIVFAGTGRVAEPDSLASSEAPPRNLRVLAVSDNVENCGLRKIGLRRSSTDAALWEIYVSARNYGSAPRAVTLALGFGGSPIGSRRLILPPGADREATFEYRTRAAGLLEARLLPGDAFPDDDHAVFELPAQPILNVTVYSEQPELLRAALSANPRLNTVFRRISEYRDSDVGLVVLDRFQPPRRPAGDSIWIDPPAQASPVPVRARVANEQFTRWRSEHPLGAGLWTRDVRLESASIFEPAPGDVRIGEVAKGPVIVARPGKPKIVVIGFHPALSAMRYELATPLLFANILRWMQPEIFRRWELSGGSVGTVKLALDPDVSASDIRIVREDGTPVPFTFRDRSLHFYSGSPGAVRVLAGDREFVYSLTLPQLWESRWQPPAGVRRGIPGIREAAAGYTELWHWLALLGGLGLLTEWLLFGRLARSRKAPLAIRARVRKAS
jgi:hypothetical protein